MEASGRLAPPGGGDGCWVRAGRDGTGWGPGAPYWPLGRPPRRRVRPAGQVESAAAESTPPRPAAPRYNNSKHKSIWLGPSISLPLKEGRYQSSRAPPRPASANSPGAAARHAQLRWEIKQTAKQFAASGTDGSRLHTPAVFGKTRSVSGSRRGGWCTPRSRCAVPGWDGTRADLS